MCKKQKTAIFIQTSHLTHDGKGFCDNMRDSPDNLTIQTKLKIQPSKAAGFLILRLLIIFQAHRLYTIKGKIM